MNTTTHPFLILVAALLLTALPTWAQDTSDDFYWCPVEPGPGTVITPGNPDGGTGGGMAGNGWDGAGANAATIFWHVDGTTPDFGAGQRAAMIAAMQAWANVVQITFREIPLANQNQSIDWDFLVWDHSATEPAEAGDPDCAFDGTGGSPNTLAHAGFPPGVNSACVNPMAESWAGNVHFDESETWELDNAGGWGPWSTTFVACHELGHSIGLTHSNGAPDIMAATGNSNQAFAGLSANDIANIQAGYAAGTGSVITLETSGIWVDGSFGGTELGTQASPFDTVAEGPPNVPPFASVIVHIETGTYAESPLIISDAAILNAENGTVRIE